MSRRSLVAALSLLYQAPIAYAGPAFGDSEWHRRFELFIRELNQFIMALNDDRLDLARWARVQKAWDSLSGEPRQ